MQAVEQPVGLPPEPVCRLTVDQYHSMLRSGVLDEDSRVELLEGWLVPNVSKNPPHALVVQRLEAIVSRLLPAGWYARRELPVTLGDSEPEPDLAVVPGTMESYASRHPGAAEIALIVEVADATLLRDRTTKKRMYARAGIPHYWLADLTSRRLLVWTRPQPSADDPDYAACQVYGEDDEVPLALSLRHLGVIRIGDLLP